jgi:hypothetical protein
MTRTLPRSALLAAALLAGCASSPDQDAPAAKGDGRCDAEAVQNLVDQRIVHQVLYRLGVAAAEHRHR